MLDIQNEGDGIFNGCGIGSFSFTAPEMNSLSVSFVVETVLGKVNMTTEIIS